MVGLNQKREGQVSLLVKLRTLTLVRMAELCSSLNLGLSSLRDIGSSLPCVMLLSRGLPRTLKAWVSVPVFLALKTSSHPAGVPIALHPSCLENPFFSGFSNVEPSPSSPSSAKKGSYGTAFGSSRERLEGQAPCPPQRCPPCQAAGGLLTTVPPHSGARAGPPAACAGVTG